MLRVENIHTYYGLSHILFDVSLSLAEGEIVGLLGRNGAGKSTTMRSIACWTPPRQGSITFKGRSIAGTDPFLLVREGIAYVPDDRRVFADLSVDDNLEITYRRNNEWPKQRVYDLFPALSHIKTRPRGKPLGRGAADAYDWKSLNEQSGSPSVGRADGRFGSSDCQGAGKADLGAEGCRDQHSPFGTERKIGLEIDRPGLCDR